MIELEEIDASDRERKLAFLASQRSLLEAQLNGTLDAYEQQYIRDIEQRSNEHRQRLRDRLEELRSQTGDHP